MAKCFLSNWKFTGQIQRLLCNVRTYNYAPVLSPKQWQDYLFENLTQIWKFTRLSMIFNLSVADEARITNQNISYFNKDNVKNFCANNLGRTNLFLSEKLPKEVTFHISKV